MTSIVLQSVPALIQSISRLPCSLGGGEILLATASPVLPSENHDQKGDLHRASEMEANSSSRFLAGRRLLRCAISSISGIPRDEVGIDVDAIGKPYITNFPYHVGIAHSGDTVGVVMASFSVGLDLECPRKIDAKGLSRRFFSREEAVAICETSDDALFFECWTRREAAVKADGRGLGKALALSRVNLNDVSGGIRDVIIGEDTWSTLHWVDHVGIHAALAFRTMPVSILWCDLRGTDIL